jgi:ribose transport system substrate-binding protein
MGMARRLRFIAFLLLPAQPGWAVANDGVADAKAVVADAAGRTQRWTGPVDGPVAVAGKTVALVAENLHNGGVLGVAQGVREAAAATGWKVKVLDAGGAAQGRAKAFADALAARPDGLIVVGADAVENRAALQPFHAAGIPVVGWHVAAQPGPVTGTAVATNITTDPLAVARVTALAAVAQSEGRAGVVIFTDSNFRIAMAKAEAMAQAVRACGGCTVLEVRDVAIADAEQRMPAVTRELLQRHGARWTHALAINDIYFDHALPVLTGQRVSLLSAGDGSAGAFQRIRSGALQTATVAEPLRLHGWQAVDELNRLLAGRSVSGYVAPVHLVTPDNVSFDGGPGLQYDPDNGYRLAYQRIWKR